MESNHAEEVKIREANSKVMWDQIGKMNGVQNDTALKLATVGTQFADHTKDDDKFSATVADSLKGIAAQIRDITISSARVAPAVAPVPVAPAATVPTNPPSRP